jgi:hypothetical protein
LDIGALAIDAIRGWQSPTLPWLESVSLDPYVFGFTIGVAVVAALLFGAAPAIAGSRANLIDALKTSSLRMSGISSHRLPRNTFMVAEIALALVLLIAAGLLVRSFRELLHIDPGYKPHNVLTASVQLPEGAPMPAFVAEALPELKALPGIKYAALAGQLPLQPYHSATAVWFGPAMRPRESWPNLRVPLIGATPDFFRAMGATLFQGRAFHDGDDENAPGDPHCTSLVVGPSALRASAESNRPALPAPAHPCVMPQDFVR